MRYLGNYAEDATNLAFLFSTQDSTGAPIALVGGAAAVYKGSNTTQSTAGVTLTASFDGVTGLNHIAVDLSSDAFYVTGEDYSIVLTAGTVDAISVANRALATFSIENRAEDVDAASMTALIGSIPTAALISDAVWDELVAAHSGAGSTGDTLADILAGVDPAMMTAVIAAVSALGAGTVTVTSPVTATGVVTLIQGDTYSAADVTWTDTGSTWPADIATADSLTWYADTLEIACTYNAGTSAIELGALTAAQTAELQAGSHTYRIVARWTVGSRVETIGTGTLNVETYRP